MDNIYKTPNSDLDDNHKSVIVGHMRAGRAVFFAPLATPILWAVVVAPILIITNGASSDRLLALFALAFLFPVVVSYGVTLLLGAPLYFLFIKLGWTSFFVFNSGALISTIVCVSIFSLINNGDAYFFVTIPIFLFALFNSCLMWYLMYKPKLSRDF